MSMEESPDTRFRYTIWFDYTRESINKIQEGTMLAVANFGSDCWFSSLVHIGNYFSNAFAFCLAERKLGLSRVCC